MRSELNFPISSDMKLVSQGDVFDLVVRENICSPDDKGKLVSSINLTTPIYFWLQSTSDGIEISTNNILETYLISDTSKDLLLSQKVIIKERIKDTLQIPNVSIDARQLYPLSYSYLSYMNPFSYFSSSISAPITVEHIIRGIKVIEGEGSIQLGCSGSMNSTKECIIYDYSTK